MASDQAFLDSGELRLIGSHIEVDVLERSDPFSVTIDQVLAVPLAEDAVGDGRVGLGLGVVRVRFRRVLGSRVVDGMAMIQSFLLR